MVAPILTVNPECVRGQLCAGNGGDRALHARLDAIVGSAPPAAIA